MSLNRDRAQQRQNSPQANTDNAAYDANNVIAAYIKTVKYKTRRWRILTMLRKANCHTRNSFTRHQLKGT